MGIDSVHCFAPLSQLPDPNSVMIRALRSEFNSVFTPERYSSFLAMMDTRAGTHIEFRICETPVFVPEPLEAKLFAATCDILRQLVTDTARRNAQAAFPRGAEAPDESAHPEFAQVDFAVTREQDGQLGIRLIELQGFPSLYAFQEMFGRTAREFYGYGSLRHLAPSLSAAAFHDLFRLAVVGQHDPSEVILLEVDPLHQKTLPDFLLTESLLGIETVDITTVIKKDRQLFYLSKSGRHIPIRRIYNRVIMDEIVRRGIRLPFAFTDSLDLEWACHPNWFYRISKFSLPFIEHQTVPPARILDGIGTIPDNLEDYVLKPLYSFAGGGVIVGPARAQVESIPVKMRGKYLLQERVRYAPILETPSGPAFVELRVMVLWIDEPVPVMLLARTGKGAMMGVDYNSSTDWVGASCALISA